MGLLTAALAQTVPISTNWTYVPVDAPAASITYFQLRAGFKPGPLFISAGSGTNAVNFTYVIPALQYGRFVSPGFEATEQHPKLKLDLVSFLASPNLSLL